MIELRWVVPAETSTKPPVLQFRYSPLSDWATVPLALVRRTDWQDVPTVVLPKVAPKPAMVATGCIDRPRCCPVGACAEAAMRPERAIHDPLAPAQAAQSDAPVPVGDDEWHAARAAVGWDAKRYQWLRMNWYYGPHHGAVRSTADSGELDDAIDAMMFLEPAAPEEEK